MLSTKVIISEKSTYREIGVYSMPKVLCYGNGVFLHLEMVVTVMGFAKDFRYSYFDFQMSIFCPICNLSCANGILLPFL